MSIPIFKKPLLAIGALASAAGVYLCVILLMNSLSVWAERELDSFPFKQEDWLRYLLPSKFSQNNKKMIMLTGPSTVRENLLYERFKQEFPDHEILQGGISLGTMEDVTTALEYILKAYGKDALPEILVLGISPRFIGNIPGDRPFSQGIDLYSPYFSTSHGGSGITLVEKGLLSSILSEFRFTKNKAPERYRTTMFALMSYWMNSTSQVNASNSGKHTNPVTEVLNALFRLPIIREQLGKTRYKRALNYQFSELIAWFSSPYKYNLDPKAKVRGLTIWMNGEDSWWRTVHNWDPTNTGETARLTLKKFIEFTKNHNIRLIVVNMPERDISRIRYNASNYQAYINMVKKAIENAPFLDMRTFLTTDEFHDLEHSIYPGSLRLTNEVIKHLKQYITGLDTRKSSANHL